MRTTYTYALLPVSKATYDEIAGKLRVAGYDHVFDQEGVINLHGLAIGPPVDVNTNSEAEWLARKWAQLGRIELKAVVSVCQEVAGRVVAVVLPDNDHAAGERRNLIAGYALGAGWKPNRTANPSVIEIGNGSRVFFVQSKRAQTALGWELSAFADPDGLMVEQLTVQVRRADRI